MKNRNGNTSHVRSKCLSSHGESDDNRSDDGDCTRKHHFAECSFCGDVNTLSVLRLSRPFHNSRNFAELTTNFVNHVHCSASNRLHRESREDNWNHTSDEKRSEHIGFKDVDSVDSCKRYVSGEKRDRKSTRLNSSH